MKNAFKATTPFPNILLDVVMPRLKDTEWRLLCVIVRQTLGWQDGNTRRRKERDWLSRDQLKARTGRNAEALSLAINALVSQGYVTAHNGKGTLLETSADRRANHSRIYYGLSEQWKEKTEANKRESGYGKTEYGKTEYGKTEYGKTEHKKFRQRSATSSLFLSAAPKTKLTGTAKPNTTKETPTKENGTKGICQQSLDGLAVAVFRGESRESAKAFTQKPLFDQKPLFNGERLNCGREYSREAQEFVILFWQLCERLKKHRPDVRLSGSDAARLEKLCGSRPSLDWTPTLQAFFASDAGYIARRDHSLPAFLDSCHIFLLLQRPGITLRAGRKMA